MSHSRGMRKKKKKNLNDGTNKYESSRTMSTHPGSESERPAAGLLEQRKAGGQRCSLPSPFIQPKRQAFPQVHNHGPLPSTTPLRCYSRNKLHASLSSFLFSPFFAPFSAPELLLCLSGRMCVLHQKGNFTDALGIMPGMIFSTEQGVKLISGCLVRLLNLITHLSPSSHSSAQLSPFLFNGQPGSLHKQTFKWLAKRRKKKKRSYESMRAKRKSLFMPLQRNLPTS